MHQIDKVARKVADEMQSVFAATEQPPVFAEEITSASDALTKLAQDIKNTMRKFKIRNVII